MHNSNFSGQAPVGYYLFQPYEINSRSSCLRSSQWNAEPIDSVYIPVKEMLANAPGFRSLYAQRDLHFEEIYDDILARAYIPILRGPIDQERKKLLDRLRKIIAGKVRVSNEEFFLRGREGNLEFSLLAEGMRKLGLLWLLVQNGTLLNGSVLFWDEPETNLNPRLLRPWSAFFLNCSAWVSRFLLRLMIMLF